MLRVLPLLIAASLAPAAWLPIGPYGGHIQSFALDPAAPDRMYCATFRYPAEPLLFRSTDAGASWTAAGKFRYSDVASLVVDPFRPSTLLACSRGNLVWRSEDAGETWQAITINGHAAQIAADPAVDGRCYGAGYVEAGHPRPAFLLSTDHGLTWSATPLDTSDGGLQACRVAGPALYLGGDHGLVFRSTDRGLTWDRRNSGLPVSEPVLSLAAAPSQPGVLLAGATTSLWRSADTGRTWTAIPGIQKVSDLRFAGTVAYALCRDSIERVVVSTDLGLTWSGPASDSMFYRALVLHPDPRDPDVAWVNSGQGLLRTTDRGATWLFRNHGLDFADVYTIGVNPADRRELCVSAHDTRIFRTTDCGGSWTRTRGFWCMYNGMCCALAFGPGGLLYGFEGSG